MSVFMDRYLSLLETAAIDQKIITKYFCFKQIQSDFSLISFWQHELKQLMHVLCFVSLSNIFSLVYNLTMNRPTN